MNKCGLLVLFLALILFAGCKTNKNNIYESSKKQTYLPYSDLARISHLSLEHDGYIIGIEKRTRTKEEIDNAPEARGKRERFAIVDLPDNDLPDDCCLKSEKERKRFKRNVQKRNEKFVDYISDGSIMFVSHIASYFENEEEGDVKNAVDYNKHRRPSFLYNAYDVYKDDSLDYEKGYEALKVFKKDLEKRLNDNIYSHIILFCMGWNNNQQESIYRYNEIVSNLNIIAPEGTFKPLIIGFTWPSAWKTIEDSWLRKNMFFLASYFTKQDDADEIGMTIANWLTHNIVLKVKNGITTNPPKVIAIGHSMGARMLSRAIFSDGYLVSKENSESQVDLFIGLQGAFSANRFVAFDGWEGSPYAEFKCKKTVISLTTSKNDNANPIAAFITGAKHTGGNHGLRVAKKESNEGIFQVVTWAKGDTADKFHLMQTSNNQDAKKKVIMIDAKEIVVDKKDDSSKESEDFRTYPIDAHNDILDEDMAELIWALIKTFACWPAGSELE